MKQISKKLLSILLSLVMVLGLLPGMSLTALADGDAEETVTIAENASLDGANTSRNLAVGQDGVIHIVYRSGDSIFYRKSTNSGSTFSEPVTVATGDECEVAVSSTGRAFVAYVNNGNLYIAYSDNGTSFTPVPLGANSSSLHIAVDGSHVYAIPQAGTAFFYSSDGGQSYASHTGWERYAFSDVHIDESNHNVVILKDNPKVVCRYSSDYGVTFSDESPVKCGEDQIQVYFSTAAVGKGYAYMAGNNASNGSTDYLYKIDYINATATGTPISACDSSAQNGRSLSADHNDNVVVGYVSNGKACYQVSLNGGETVGSGVEFADAGAANAAINTKTGDVLFLYESDGKIMVYKAAGVVPGDSIVYNGELQYLLDSQFEPVCQEEGARYVLGTNDQTAPTEGWGDAIPQGKDAGFYYVWVQSNTTESTCKIVEIVKANALKTKPKGDDAINHDGAAHALAVAGEAASGKIVYALGESDTQPAETAYSETIPKAAEKGDYTVWYKVVEFDAQNFYADEPQSVKSNIDDYHTLTYAPGAGTGEPYTVMVKDGASTTIPKNKFTAPDEKFFTGWSDGSAVYPAGASYTPTDSVTLTAQWADGYLIPDHGTNTVDLTGKATGYSFAVYDYYGPSENFGSDWDGTLTITPPESKALYIAGTVELTQSGSDSFSISGPSGVLKSFTVPGSVDMGTAESSVSLQLITNGYGEPAPGVSLTVTVVDKTTLSFDAGEGTGSMADQDVAVGAPFTLPACTLTAPAGKVFTGWSDGNKVYGAGTSYTPTGNATLTAQWTLGTTISYELTDSYGDGWNGAAIKVTDKETGNVIATLTVESGSGASGTLDIPAGRTVVFTWVSGRFDNECSYTVKDAEDNVIFSGAGAMAEPNEYRDDMDIPTYTVTFKVVNGKWDDDTTADKTVILNGYEGDTLKLASNQIPAVGKKPNDTYKAGSWDVTPDMDTVITGDTTYTYTYAQKEPAVVTKVPEKISLTYNGEARDLVTEGTASGGEMQYALGADATTAPTSGWSDTIPKGTDAGTYYVWYKVKGDTNHYDTEANCVEVTIAPKAMTGGAEGVIVTYDGQPHSISVNVTEPTGAAVLFKKADETTYSETNPSFTDVGEYTVEYKVTKSNYIETTGSAVVLIEPKELEIEWSDTDLTYNGREQKPTAAIRDETANVVSGDALDITVSGGQKNANTAETPEYTATASIGNTNYKLKEDTAVTPFTIAKLTAVLDWSKLSLQYNGNEQLPVAEVTNQAEGDNLRVTLTGAGKEVGIYIATAIGFTGEGAANYELPAANTKLYSIGKATLNPSVSIDDWTYGDAAEEPVVDGVPEGVDYTIAYKVYGAKNNTYTTEKPEKAGTYNICVTVTEDDDYNAVTSEDSFTIREKEVGLSWGNTEFVYNGKDRLPTVEVTGLLEKDAGKVGADVIGASTDVGTHTAIATRLTGEAASNYRLPSDAKTAFVIVKSDLSENPENNPVTLSMEGWTYGDDAREPVVENNIGGGTVNYSYAKIPADGQEPEYVKAKPGEAGDYIVKAEIGATENYNSATLMERFTIEPKTAVLVWSDTSFVYDGKEHVPVCEVANTVKGDKCEVTVTGARSAAGEYEAEAVGLSNANYVLPVSRTTVYHIAKDSPALTVSMTGWTYGDEAKEPSVEGNTGNGTVTYTYYTDKECTKQTTESDGAAEAGKVPAKAGTYYVKAEAEATAGYEAGSAVAEFTIGKKTLALEWTKTSLTYNGKEQAPQAQATNLVNGDELTLTVSGAKKDAGEYEAAVNALDENVRNYTLPEVTTQKYVIAKKVAELSWGETEFIYNSKDQIPAVSVSNLEEGDTCELTVVGAATAVGKHTATVTKLLNNNYELPKNAEMEFTITKAELPAGNDPADNPATLTMAGWTYGEDPAEPVIENNIGAGTVNYSYAKDTAEAGEEGTLEYTSAKPNDAGAYVVKAEIGETESYNALTLYSRFVIAPKTAELGWSGTSFVYDGGEHVPACEVTNLVKGDKCEVTVSGAASTAGEHEAVATALSNANYALPTTTTQNFVIAKDRLALTVSMTGWIYGDEAKEPVVEGNTGNGTVTYTYYTDKECTKQTTESDGAAEAGKVPAKAGTYYVKAEAEATAGYEAGSAVAEFTIEKKTLALEWTKTSLTYNGKEQAPEVSAANLKEGNEVVLTVDGAKKDAGEYEAAVTMTGAVADNYELPKVTTQKYVIAKKVAELSWGETEFIYNSKDQIPTVSVSNLEEGDTCELTVIGAATAVGTHTATVYQIQNSNYALPKNVQKEFTIVKSDLGDDAKVTIEGWTYGETPNVPIVAGNAEGANVTYQYKKAGEPDSAYTATVPTLAGDYTVMALIESTAGYNAKTPTADFTIAKAHIVVTADAKTVTYGDKEAELTYQVSGLVKGDSTDEALTGAMIRNKGNDAGTYEILQGTLEAANYSVSYNSADYVIQKAPQAAPAETFKVQNANEGAADGEISGFAAGKTYQYSADGGKTWRDLTAASLTDLKAGSYQLRYAEDKNHMAGAAKTVTVGSDPIPEEKVNELAINGGLKVTQKGSRIGVKWGKVEGADGYEIYVEYCGKTKFGGRPEKTVKAGKTSVKITRVNGKKLNLKKNFKLYVRAYKNVNGRKVTLSKSIVAHVVGRKNRDNTNAKSITVLQPQVSLTIGETHTIQAKTNLVDRKKKQLSNAHAKEFRYASSNENIATVDANGKVTAKRKGACIIYVYSRNGLAKTVTVTVS